MKVSIIIRAYNAEATISRAIESALAQNFPPDEYEILIVDDGSTDGTAAVINEYTKDRRVKMIRQDNKGAVESANIGFNAASGEYVSLLDSDDEYAHDLLAVSAGVLDADISADFTFADYDEEFGGQMRTVALHDLFQTIADNTMYRKQSLAAEGFYRADALLFPEYDLLLRTFGRWRGVHISRSLVTYHRRLESLTGNSREVEAAIEDLRKRYPERAEEIKKIRSYAL